MTEIARMYGGSLYDLAAEEGLETRILGSWTQVNALFKANPDYLHLLSIPSIPKKSAAACWTRHCGGRSTSMCSTF